MSDQEQTTKTPEEIRAEIAQTREELGDTVEALGAKTDVKGRAHEKVEEVKSNASAKVDDVKASAQSTAQEVKSDPVGTVKSNPAPFAIAAGVLIVILLWRRRAD